MKTIEMQDTKKESLYIYEVKESRKGKIRTLKNQGGRICFMKAGFNPWKKIEHEEVKSDAGI